MALSDEDSRHFLIEILTQPTDRDRQVLIGASDLSNGCDYCLASALLGISRDTPITDRAWGGRVNGTAVHGEIQRRLNEMLATLSPQSIARGNPVNEIAARYPDTLVEFNILLGHLVGYGDVRTTADLVLPGERHAFDWKGTDKEKLAVLIDYIAISKGESAPYGRKHSVHKAKPLSEKVYEEKMADMEFKVVGYYNQLQLYGLGLARNNVPVDRLSIGFIARDDTMWFDNPAANRYDDPSALHGTFILSFDYNREYAEAVWQRGVTLWERLQASEVPSDFAHHQSCFPCGLDSAEELKAQAYQTSAEELVVPFNETTFSFDQTVVDAMFDDIITNS